MAAKDGRIEILYACGHKRTFDAPYPVKGSDVYCLKCQNETTVIASADELFRVKCDGCTFGRAYGTDRRQASRAASLHAVRRSGHTVALIKDGKVLVYVSANGGVDFTAHQLPFEELARERRELANEVQQMLRDARIVT